MYFRLAGSSKIGDLSGQKIAVFVFHQGIHRIEATDMLQGSLDSGIHCRNLVFMVCIGSYTGSGTGNGGQYLASRSLLRFNFVGGILLFEGEYRVQAIVLRPNGAAKHKESHRE